MGAGAMKRADKKRRRLNPLDTTPLKMNKRIYGWGMYGVKCNGKLVWMQSNEEWDQCWTVQRAENLARKRRGDWRIVFVGPLSHHEYQRHGRNRWMLVVKGLGFA